MIFGVSNAYAEGVADQSGIGMIASFIPFVIIFVIFYFLLILPQQKKAKKVKSMLEALKKGDKVVTTGGILGVISNISDKGIVTLQISDNSRIKILKEYISDLRGYDDE